MLWFLIFYCKAAILQTIPANIMTARSLAQVLLLQESLPQDNYNVGQFRVAIQGKLRSERDFY